MISNERRLRDLTTICEISLQINSAMEIAKLLDLVTFYATVLLEAERAAMLQADHENQVLTLSSSYGEWPEGWEPGGSMRGTAASELMDRVKQGTILVPPERRHEWTLLSSKSQAWTMIVAIVCKQKVMGVLLVEEKITGEPFSDYESGVLQMLVAQAAIAMENAHIYRSLDYLVGLRTHELEAERDNVQKLLLNILPGDIVDELQAHGAVTPRRYDSVSVLFTDFCDFTGIAEKLSPERLLNELERFYNLFDEICVRHGLERLKTIGDAYMCVAGAPTPNPAHAVNTVRAALDIAECVLQTQVKHLALQAPIWRIRMGVHSGPVIAGMVGKRRLAYDIWGDTVNVASRMQSNGMPDRVNISAATHALVYDQFLCEPRHLVEVKGKGPLQMYWVTAPRGHF